MNSEDEKILDRGISVMKLEAESIIRSSTRLEGNFVNSVKLLFNTRGRVIVSGMGKSGHIARKMAATLASTGTPSFFVHPAEAAHGDLGMITESDTVLLISNSGESSEVIALLPSLKKIGSKIIGMTGNVRSALAREANYILDISVESEACPLGLAPTTSTTVTLALGDALAIALLELRGFKKEDFAMSHPGGALGRRLLTRVSDLMRRGESLPIVKENSTLTHSILEVTGKGLGFTAVVNSENKIVGIFTDGDLRRIFQKGIDIHGLIIKDVMTKNPRVIQHDKMAVESLYVMQKSEISGLLVVDDSLNLVGAITLHDLLKAGIV